jgi:hypothetical protein
MLATMNWRLIRIKGALGRAARLCWMPVAITRRRGGTAELL